MAAQARGTQAGAADSRIPARVLTKLHRVQIALNGEVLLSGKHSPDEQRNRRTRSRPTAILTKATGHGGMTISAHLAEFFSDIGGNGAFAVVIALYTAVLGLLVPSGGGK